MRQVTPYSGAQSKTLIEARRYLSELFYWYNHEHRHSAITLMAPADVHYGYPEEIISRRKMVLDLAYLSHPERFVNKAPTPPFLPEVVWINQPAEELMLMQ